MGYIWRATKNYFIVSVLIAIIFHFIESAIDNESAATPLWITQIVFHLAALGGVIYMTRARHLKEEQERKACQMAIAEIAVMKRNQTAPTAPMNLLVDM